MPMAISKWGASRKALAALAAACATALMLAAAVDQAEARKGGQFKAPMTGTSKAPPSPSRVVRDHRGQPQALPPGKGGCWGPKCSPYACGYKGACPTVRDHRTSGKGQCRNPPCKRPGG